MNDSHQPTATLTGLGTPSLILDREKMMANIELMRQRLAGRDVVFRPHLKTAKSVEISRLMMSAPSGPGTVSTLKEAEQFADAGITDLTYAVGITQDKLDRVSALRRRGVDLSIVLDSVEAAEAVACHARAAADPIPVLIEIDTDGHRAGVQPADVSRLIAIGRALDDGGATLLGVLTHAGSSYGSRDLAGIKAAAQQERDGAVRAAETLRAAGLPASVVSVGSTPTVVMGSDLSGVTEVRAGVYVFFDLVMAGLGVCTYDQIATSVLTTVVGRQRERGWILVDAGWMSMSRDRGTAAQEVDQGYGLAIDLDGRVYEDLVMVGANQEQGILAIREGSAARLPDLGIGDRLRVLPNHACATAAQYDRYHVVDGGREINTIWDRFGGW